MQQETYYEDEIDLRELITTLLQGWKVILALTLIAAFVTFVLSQWVLPKQFQATAYVFIAEPKLHFAETGEISIRSNLPDMKSVVELAKSPALLKKVMDSPQVTALGDIERKSLEGMVEVNSIGEGQLRLQVTDTDPERAALLANIWAEAVTKKINSLYGLDAITQELDTQVSQVEADYIQAQEALEKELAKNQVAILQTQLDHAKEDLSCTLSRSSASERILEDIHILEENLANKTNPTLSLGDALALITLQQRTSASQICASETQNPQLQITNASLEISLADALNTLAQMRNSLQIQASLLEKEQTRQEAEITTLQRDLENAKYQLEKHEQTRDQLKDLYTALLQQKNQTTTTLLTSGNVATLSSPAMVPAKKSAPKSLLNTAFASIFGFTLGIFFVFARSWWLANKEGEKGLYDN